MTNYHVTHFKFWEISESRKPLIVSDVRPLTVANAMTLSFLQGHSLLQAFSSAIFTVRLYASAVYSVVLCLCVFVGHTPVLCQNG